MKNKLKKIRNGKQIRTIFKKKKQLENTFENEKYIYIFWKNKRENKTMKHEKNKKTGKLLKY